MSLAIFENVETGEMFQEITTEETMSLIESESEKYQGLYVDMNDKEQRKYVKDGAANINGILKRLDRARIDKAKQSKFEIESEAARIRTRLEAANEPFTLLIDEWDAQRKQTLEAEKARKAAVELAIQKDIDHDTALMLDKVYLIEKREREEAQAAHEQFIREQAKAEANERHSREMEEAKQRAIEAEQRALQQAQAAAQAEIDKAEAAKQRELAEKQAREASKEHVRGINRSILVALMQKGISEEDGKTVVSLAARKLAGNLTINY